MKDFVNSIIDKLQEVFPVNRIVVLLTPVFAALSGWAATWAAENMPGLPPLDPHWLAGIFVAGAVAAITAAYAWIDGWQGYEQAKALWHDPDGALSDPLAEVDPSEYDSEDPETGY